MLFKTEEEEVALRQQYECPTGDIQESFLRATGDYIRQIKGYRRGMITKHNWKKYRYEFRSGMRKFHRSLEGRSVHRELANGLRQALGKVGKDFSVKFEEFGAYGLLGKLSYLKGYLLEETSYYQLEENYVEMAVLSELMVGAVRAFEEAIFKGTLVEVDQVELLLCLIGEEVLRESWQLPDAPILETDGFVDLIFK